MRSDTTMSYTTLRSKEDKASLYLLILSLIFEKTNSKIMISYIF